MRKSILFFCSLLISLALEATETETVNVHQWNGTVHQTLLNDIQSIRFNSEETMMFIHTINQQRLTYEMAEIRKVTFNDSTVDALEAIESTPQDGVQKILENGHVVIVRDGVRYNILGMRL